MFTSVRSSRALLQSLSVSASSQTVRMIHSGRILGSAKKSDTNTNEPNDIEEPRLLRAQSVMATEDADAAETPTRGRKKTERALGYKGWLLTEGKRYKQPTPGRTAYVGGLNRPFPLNPFFRARPPVPDSTKEAIYASYLKDPVKNTPRVLGQKFGISIVRAEAILKLKAIEHHMVELNGFVAQKKFTKGMEDMMGVSSKQQLNSERLLTQRTGVSGPRFHAVPEGQSFTAVDAAEVLGRKPFQQIVDRMAASKPYVIDYEGLDIKYAPRPEKKLSNSEIARLDSLGPAEETVISQDSSLGNNRWKFVFTDIDKTKEMGERQVLVRESDGTLKVAGRDYKLKRYGQLWYH
ncbi:hypothetical protein GGI07_003826 [Coemansia sp. Benny D115]|nr:hypothetical protein GGI07_003826 [Coemansia sp. Benny D115]